jgi:uncharacterized protein (TIGR03086 family)
MDELVERHRSACAGFSRLADQVRADQWEAPTPCSEWDARALVEHVIGFHDFLLLRPLGARANRPRSDPAARWAATSDALFDALDGEGVLDRTIELPGGGRSSPRRLLGALTTDVLVHSWDLARAAGLPDRIDADACAHQYAALDRATFAREGGMFGPEIPVAPDADAVTKLVAFYGRDPAWTPS